jgi:hypothetical protein
MYAQARRRLAIGFTGLLMATSLVVGAVSVAADERDVNEGAQGTGLANQAILTTSGVAAPTVAGYDITLAAPTALVENRDDRSE